MLLCDHCITAFYGRGEKVIKLESLYFNEDFDESEEVTCEGCEEAFIKDQIFDCVFP